MSTGTEPAGVEGGVPVITVQPDTGKNQLAVADGTPSNGHTEKPVPREGERRETIATAPEVLRTSSTDETTESDSEKDAVEVYVSGKSGQASGEQTTLLTGLLYIHSLLSLGALP